MIRRAIPSDAIRLSRLHRHIQTWHANHYPDAFFSEPNPTEVAHYFYTRLSEPNCSAFLSGDPATGYALCQLHTREPSIFSPGCRRLMVDHIAVAPEARRQGQGRALLQAARDLARELKADEILLDTWEANHDAHAFFRANGFTPRRMLFRATP